MSLDESQEAIKDEPSFVKVLEVHQEATQDSAIFLRCPITVECMSSSLTHTLIRSRNLILTTAIV